MHHVDFQRRSNASRAIVTARVALAAIFLAAALPKLTDNTGQVDLFRQIGLGQWLRYAVGMAELIGALGLLVPRLAWLAAGGLALDMIGATIVNTVLGNPAVLMTLPLLAVGLFVFSSLSPSVERSRARCVGPEANGRLRSRSPRGLWIHLGSEG